MSSFFPLFCRIPWKHLWGCKPVSAVNAFNFNLCLFCVFHVYELMSRQTHISPFLPGSSVPAEFERCCSKAHIFSSAMLLPIEPFRFNTTTSTLIYFHFSSFSLFFIHLKSASALLQFRCIKIQRCFSVWHSQPWIKTK